MFGKSPVVIKAALEAGFLNRPLLITGCVPGLQRYAKQLFDLKGLEKVVSWDLFDLATSTLTPGSSCPIYLNRVLLHSIKPGVSRHNSRHNAASLYALMKGDGKSLFGKEGGTLVVFCESQALLGYSASVARAFPLYNRKTSSLPGSDFSVNVEFVVVDDKSEATTGLSDLGDERRAVLQSAVDGVSVAQCIVDTPCDEMNVDQVLEVLTETSELLPGVKLTVIRGEELTQRGFGGIYNVGRASCCPPALATLSWTPPNATETISWVGKGIVYDTGGLSLKSRAGMCGMKRDCGGAAGVLGAFYLAVKSGFTQNLHAVFCIAENSIGPFALRPDDVITMYSGKTVEINNPDAEGRLVLGDGVCYARKDLGAMCVVDMATLTGAQGPATGKTHAALLSNKAWLEEAATEAGRSSADLSFPIIYCPELHFSEYNSAIADMKNSVADRSNALTSCAGLFIESHLGPKSDECHWLHIDMASPAHIGERATGYGVCLLPTLFGRYSESPLLQSMGPPLSSCNGPATG